METTESINDRFRKSVKRNFNLTIYPLILGVVMGYGGLVREYYQTRYIPMHEWNENRLSTSNKIMGFTGIGIALSSLTLQAGLNVRAKRRRDHELESLSDSDNEIDTGLPFTP